MNILIIDDDRVLIKNIKKAFKFYNFCNRVDVLYSYVEFLHHNTNIRYYDIILLDVNLWWNQSKTGFDILNHIRDLKISIPIIMISWYDEYSFIRKSFLLGAHDYIQKPFRNRELQIRIQRWFHNYIISEYSTWKKQLIYKDIIFDLIEYEFYIWETKIYFSKWEKYLFSLFFIYKEKLLTYNFLSEKIWWWWDIDKSSALRIKIMRLKRQLALHWMQNDIVTVRWEWHILQRKGFS